MANLTTRGPTALSSNTWSHMRRFSIDCRDADFDQANMDEVANIMENYADPARMFYTYTYRFPLATVSFPDGYFRCARFWYNYQPNFNGATAFPDIPAAYGAIIDYVYFTQRQSSANALGGTTIADVPTSWRNMTGAFRFNMERLEASSAQQVGIVNGIEREILAGLSENYTSTSTTTRYIDFQNTSAGSNDALVQADLVAQGWTVVNGNQMEKFISANGAAARRWRVLHN